MNNIIERIELAKSRINQAMIILKNKNLQSSNSIKKEIDDVIELISKNIDKE